MQIVNAFPDDAATIQPDATSGPAGKDAPAARFWRNKPAPLSTRRAQQALRHALSHDQLTGLPNAAHFREHLERALELAGRGERNVMLLALDLDRFKRVNACAGHMAGDIAIRDIAARICSVAGSCAIVARDHGDKFLLLLDRSLDCHAEVARALMQAVAAPLPCGGTDLYLTCSIGIAMYGRDGDNAPDLLLAADRALERTPEGGLAIVDDAADQAQRAAIDRFRLAADLHRGLARGELQVHYQPQVDLASGKIAGFEALVRWPHPERGPIDPATLVAAAEECGLIDALGEWVLRTACARVQEWRRLPGNLALRVAVNLSPRQFARDGLAETVARALADTGLPPACLELELTESVLMTDLEGSRVALQALKQLGVRLSLDDFGTGYSSLSYLQHFPIDTLKIDRSVLREVPETRQAAALVESIVGMGSRLGMRVIAEGVE
ncbi:MAG: putative bifunctional diguanylate cyclase/phosphodiesterase, partial [Telluria sp.]